jgi:streptomycin 6-kinase
LRLNRNWEQDAMSDNVSRLDFSKIARNCERAVVTAYSDLRQLGTDDMSAYTACTTLYRIHHPESSLNEARRLVAEWIDHHVTREQQGATSGCDCA